MAQETNRTQAPLLCSTGCGFYGNPRTNGMCSICYKDFLQRQNTNGRVTESVSVPAASSSLSSLDESLSEAASRVSPVSQLELSSSQSSVSSTDIPQLEDASGKDESKTQASGSNAPAQPPAGESDKSTPRKNRCYTCRKKVGLTGFNCRCGNLFCGAHRYSDIHKCPFDYKADAAEKIRKENPVVMGEKISKI